MIAVIISEARDLKMPDEFPLFLKAGRHTDYNTSTLIATREHLAAMSPEKRALNEDVGGS